MPDVSGPGRLISFDASLRELETPFARPTTRVASSMLSGATDRNSLARYAFSDRLVQHLGGLFGEPEGAQPCGLFARGPLVGLVLVSRLLLFGTVPLQPLEAVLCLGNFGCVGQEFFLRYPCLFHISTRHGFG